MDQTLQRIQALSGALCALFTVVHPGNQAVAALGPQTYDATQRTLRAAYQAPLLELALVFAPLLVHAGTGVARIVRRRRHGERPSPAVRTRLHRWTGWFLLVFVGGHA